MASDPIKQYEPGKSIPRSARHLNQLVDAANGFNGLTGGEFINVRHVGKNCSIDLALEALLPRIPKAGGFWAIISTNSSAGSNQWTYSFNQAEKTTAGYGGWTVKSGGISGTAYNSLEDMNAATGVQGDGVNVSGADFPAGFAVQPCPAGAKVWMRVVPVGAATEYWFEYPNGIDGTCEAPA